MRMSHVLEARQQQNQRIDPRQILASEILTWTTAELEAAIEREMAENPALEVKDDGALPIGTSSLVSPAVPAPTGGLGITNVPPPAPDSPGAASDRDARLSPASASARDEWEEMDPFDRVASSLSIKEHLRNQVGQVALDASQARIVRHLIEYVDERGYLVVDCVELAADLQVTPSAVDAAITALQGMDPAGIGARDLRESLILQATFLNQIGDGDEFALPILTRCWDDLVARRESRIAQRLGTDIDTVRDSLAFLQKTLTPYPASGFRPSWENSPSAGAAAVRPDIIFRRTEAGFVVETPGDLSETLMLAPLWQKLAERPESCADDSMRRYVREHVERAEGFLKGLARRGRTLRAIAADLVELQQGFLETGNRAFLRPLTRATLSERLGLDESVISRAVAEKFAQLPSGDVIPLDAFFGNAHAVRDALSNLIAEENPANPFSDDELAEILTRQGYPLARRTVAKYRGLEKILPARLRKRV